MSNRPYAAGEHATDPHLPNEHPQKMVAKEHESVDHWQEKQRLADHKSATGKHHSVRATSTDGQESLHVLSEGEEHPAAQLHTQEPDDPLPDQQDQNK